MFNFAIIRKMLESKIFLYKLKEKFRGNDQCVHKNQGKNTELLSSTIKCKADKHGIWTVFSKLNVKENLA